MMGHRGWVLCCGFLYCGQNTRAAHTRLPSMLVRLVTLRFLAVLLQFLLAVGPACPISLSWPVGVRVGGRREPYRCAGGHRSWRRR